MKMLRKKSNFPKLKPRLCIIGPMLGRNNGWVTTQGEILTDLFRESGYVVLETSTVINRLGRLIDTVYSLFAWQKKYDIAIINVFSGPAFIMADISSAITRILNKPTIFVLRGGNLPKFSLQRKKWISRVLQRAEIIVSPSPYLTRFCETLNVNITIIPNIVNIENYPYRKRNKIEPKLLWMRTFHEIYQPEMAIEVVDKLRFKLPNLQLTMAGQEKGRLEHVKTLVKEKGLEDFVKFAGFLNQELKQNIFYEHDIYLNTNRIDNTPVSMIEAAAFGLPLIATRVGGIPDLLKDKETGLLVKNGDIDEMASAILRLLNDPNLVEILSTNGRKLAESCSWQRVKPAWEKIFTDLVVL